MLNETRYKRRTAERDTIRAKIVGALNKAKLPKPNLTNKQQIALKNLGKNKDIIIIGADKGKAVVILNKEDYESPMNPNYKPSWTMRKRTRNLIKTQLKNINASWLVSSKSLKMTAKSMLVSISISTPPRKMFLVCTRRLKSTNLMCRCAR